MCSNPQPGHQDGSRALSGELWQVLRQQDSRLRGRGSRANQSSVALTKSPESQRPREPWAQVRWPGAAWRQELRSSAAQALAWLQAAAFQRLPKVAAAVFLREEPGLSLVLAKASALLPPLGEALRPSGAPAKSLAVGAMPSVTQVPAGPALAAPAFATVALAVSAKPAAVRVVLSQTLARWFALALEIWPRIALPFG